MNNDDIAAQPSRECVDRAFRRVLKARRRSRGVSDLGIHDKARSNLPRSASRSCGALNRLAREKSSWNTYLAALFEPFHCIQKAQHYVRILYRSDCPASRD
jgi:hypothetical protein